MAQNLLTLKQVKEELFHTTGVFYNDDELINSLIKNSSSLDDVVQTILNNDKKSLAFKTEDEEEGIEENFKHPDINKDIYPLQNGE